MTMLRKDCWLAEVKRLAQENDVDVHRISDAVWLQLYNQGFSPDKAIDTMPVDITLTRTFAIDESASGVIGLGALRGLRDLDPREAISSLVEHAESEGWDWSESGNDSTGDVREVSGFFGRDKPLVVHAYTALVASPGGVVALHLDAADAEAAKVKAETVVNGSTKAFIVAMLEGHVSLCEGASHTIPAYIDRYDRLRMGLLDMLEGGRLDESDIPDDYHWLIDHLQSLSSAISTSRGECKERVDFA